MVGNYKFKVEKQKINQNVKMQNAISIAIKNGNIGKAELLSDRELIPKESISERHRDLIKEKKNKTKEWIFFEQ